MLWDADETGLFYKDMDKNGFFTIYRILLLLTFRQLL